MKEVDARGLSCPQPVIITTDAIREGLFPFSVLVDTVTSRENVSRIAEKKGCTVESSEEGEGFRMVISRS
ncbi:sulfurtransferase TusA family protein [Marispirochaeta aestuarii]|uniref:sulfurtransferase TusA family protein n=1 Tax=Marispirochaeta aestuarii TaxID=1963862 RepID=UPI002ABD3A6B|nr:sulfurtransferase TusA family protein [Marispirochaeta aestuarii]